MASGRGVREVVRRRRLMALDDLTRDDIARIGLRECILSITWRLECITLLMWFA